FDYVFDWTILKYQQSQIVAPPPRALGAAGPSSGLPHASNDRQPGSEDVRPSGWLSADSSRRRIGSLPKQKSPVGNDPASAKDAMLSNSVMRTNSSARRVVGSSSRDAVFAGSEADTSRPGIGDPTLNKVTSGHRSSPFVSSEHPRAYSGRVSSNEPNLESTIRKIESLNVNNQERLD
ncbi:hypothetical protein KSS87_005107, partial [Heliosperma pusillum]